MESMTLTADAAVAGARTERTAIRSMWVAWAWGAAVVALALGSLAFEIPLAGTDVPNYVARFSLYALTSALVFGVLGALLAANRPANRLGWLWLALATLQAVALFCNGWGLAGVWGAADLPGAPWMLWISEWASFPAYWLLPTVLLLICPDGRLPSRRWWPVAAGGIAAAALSTVGWMLLPASESDVISHPPGYVSPTPVWSGASALQSIGATIGALATAGALASFVVRYRRDPAARAQQKWIAIGGVATVVVLVAAFFEPGPGGWLIALSALPLPLAITVAVFRHRLWDVDAVINRSLVYGALTLGVVAVYVAVVALLGGLLGSTTGAPLVATALVAVGVSPARQRLGRLANRIVYGDQDDPGAVLRTLAARLDAAAGTDTLHPSVDALARALRLPYVAVIVDGETRAVSGQPSDGAETFALVYRGQPVGELVVGFRPGEGLSSSARRTVAEVARQLAVIVHADELNADLRRSRERLVIAREEERQRLRRDLHDGLGPTLAAMALQADRGRALAPSDQQEADRVLAELSARIRQTVGEVRAIVDDLGTAQLDDLGLVEAVGLLAERFSAGGLTVTVDAPKDLDGRWPAAVEIAAYRIVGEALANAARHAGAGACHVIISPSPTRLCVVITDDGVGIPDDRRSGIGIASMHQRATELGGSVNVVRLAGGGTRVDAVLPVRGSSD
jgi:signal transduction histidine kinase